MFSTSSKVAFGYILLIALLLGTLGYIFQQMTLLTETTGMEQRINNRRHSTHYLISKLYEAEIIGQALHVGKLNEYPRYKKAMREVGIAIDKPAGTAERHLTANPVRHRTYTHPEQGEKHDACT